jgi:hypothetical protein
MVEILLGFECANADTPIEDLILGREANGVKRRAGYHIALAAALALARLAVEPAEEHAFVTAFLTRWGRTLEHGPRRRRGRT